MKTAKNRLFSYVCRYKVDKKANVVLFWRDGQRCIWLGVDDFFNHFEKL